MKGEFLNFSFRRPRNIVFISIAFLFILFGLFFYITLSKAQESFEGVSASSKSVFELESRHSAFIEWSSSVKNYLYLFLLFSVVFIIFSAIALSKPVFYLLRQLAQTGNEVLKGNFDYSFPKTREAEFNLAQEVFYRISKQLRDSTLGLRESKELSRNIADNLSEGVITLDSEFRIVWANRKVAELSGYLKDNLVGKLAHEVIHCKNAPCKPSDDSCPLYESLKFRKDAFALRLYYDKDKNPFKVEVKVYPFEKEKEGIIQFVCILRDIREEDFLRDRIKRLETRLKEDEYVFQEELNKKTASLQETIEESEKQRLAIMNILEDVDKARKELTLANEELKKLKTS